MLVQMAGVLQHSVLNGSAYCQSVREGKMLANLAEPNAPRMLAYGRIELGGQKKHG